MLFERYSPEKPKGFLNILKEIDMGCWKWELTITEFDASGFPIWINTHKE